MIFFGIPNICGIGELKISIRYITFSNEIFKIFKNVRKKEQEY